MRVRNPKGSIDGMVDVVVKEEDAPRINRIVGAVQVCFCYRSGSDQDRDRKEQRGKNPTGRARRCPSGKAGAGYRKGKAERGQPQDGERSIREIPGGSTAGNVRRSHRRTGSWKKLFGEPIKKEGKQQNPSLAKTEKSRLSEPISREARQNRRGYF